MGSISAYDSSLNEGLAIVLPYEKRIFCFLLIDATIFKLGKIPRSFNTMSLVKILVPNWFCPVYRWAYCSNLTPTIVLSHFVALNSEDVYPPIF